MGTSSNLRFIQETASADNIACAEAENATTFNAGVDFDWDEETNLADAVNSAHVAAIPNNGNSYAAGAADAPSMEFTIEFNTTGTHYLWIRCSHSGDGFSDDSIHFRLDAGSWETWNTLTRASFNQAIGNDAADDWKWCYQADPGSGNPEVMTVNISSTGDHTFEIQAREDGLQIDRILFTTSNQSNYDPTNVNGGDGPAESTTESVGSSFSNSASSTLGVSDAIGSDLTVSSTLVSAIAVSDLSEASVTYLPTLISSLASSDTAAATATFSTLLQSAVAAGDQALAEAIVAAAASGSLTITDEAASEVLQIIEASSGSTLGAADNASAMAAISAALSSGVGASDQSTAQASFEPSSASSAAMSDAVSGRLLANALLASSFSPSDVLSAVMTAAAESSEVLAITDDALSSLDNDVSVSIASTFGVGDEAAAEGIYHTSLAGGISVGDVATQATIFEAQASSTDTLSDAISATAMIQGTISEDTSLSSGSSAQLTAEIVISSDLAASDIATALWNGGVSIGEALTIADAVEGSTEAFTVDLDDGRKVTVYPEKRTFIITFQQRTVDVQAEGRTFGVDSEDRLIEVQDESTTQTP